MSDIYSSQELQEMSDEQLGTLADKGKINPVDLIMLKAVRGGALDSNINVRVERGEGDFD